MIVIHLTGVTPEEVAGQREEELRRYPVDTHGTFIGPVKGADEGWEARGFRFDDRQILVERVMK